MRTCRNKRKGFSRAAKGKGWGIAHPSGARLHALIFRLRKIMGIPLALRQGATLRVGSARACCVLVFEGRRCGQEQARCGGWRKTRERLQIGEERSSSLQIIPKQPAH